MTKRFIGNFDFEHSLGATPRQALTENVRRINAELAVIWMAVACEGDFIETPEPFDEHFSDELIRQGLPAVRFVRPSASGDQSSATTIDVCPWGWTKTICNRVTQNGWTSSAPELSAVQAVNSRRFSENLEREWNVGLPGASRIDSIETLESTVGSMPQNPMPQSNNRWVLKGEFGMSGRERILGRGNQLTEQIRHWARRRLASGGVLFFEPWVERLEEAGIQFSIPPDGPPVLEGVTPLCTSSTGEYRGNRFDADAQVDETWSDAITIGHRVAKRAQQAGYFGPLGIDAVRYRAADGTVRLRPIQDVNARWTMGRVSLGFRRLLGAGECGFRLHVRPEKSESAASLCRWYQQWERTCPQGLRMIRTSPFAVGQRPVGQLTLVLIGRAEQFSVSTRRCAELLGMRGRREGDERSDGGGDFGMFGVPGQKMSASDLPGDVAFENL